MTCLQKFCCLLSALALSSTAHAAHQHAHDDHGTHHPNMSVEKARISAQKWTADADLRKGMKQVHAALEVLRQYEMGNMPANIAVETADNIDDAIAYMFNHCKLAPDADAALHRILVPLLAAAQRLKKDSSDIAAVTAMRDAMADYPRQFIDPLWPGPPSADHDGH